MRMMLQCLLWILQGRVANHNPALLRVKKTAKGSGCENEPRQSLKSKESKAWCEMLVATEDRQ
jgi:hypothetical protein